VCGRQGGLKKSGGRGTAVVAQAGRGAASGAQGTRDLRRRAARKPGWGGGAGPKETGWPKRRAGPPVGTDLAGAGSALDLRARSGFRPYKRRPGGSLNDRMAQGRALRWARGVRWRRAGARGGWNKARWAVMGRRRAGDAFEGAG